MADQQYLRELQISFVESEYQNILRDQVGDPQQLYEVFKNLEDETREKAIAVYVSGQLTNPFWRLLSVGSDNEAAFDIRYLFQMAYLTQSHSFAIIHNHPKGDPNPSEADNELIKLIQDNAERLGFGLLDFVIIGREGYWSMFETEEKEAYFFKALKKSRPPGGYNL
jgi:DNA repair protein RadC